MGLELFEDINDLAETFAQLKWKIISNFENRIRNNSNENISCDNCVTASCCKQVILSTVFEAFIIANRLKNNEEILSALLAQGKKQQEMMIDLNVKLNDLQPFLTKWFALNQMCPLRQNGKCIIYEDRPSVCSLYYVINSDPKMCEPPQFNKVTHFDTIKEISQIVELDFDFQNVIKFPFLPPMPLGSAITTIIDTLLAKEE